MAGFFDPTKGFGSVNTNFMQLGSMNQVELAAKINDLFNEPMRREAAQQELLAGKLGLIDTINKLPYLKEHRDLTLKGQKQDLEQKTFMYEQLKELYPKVMEALSGEGKQSTTPEGYGINPTSGSKRTAKASNVTNIPEKTNVTTDVNPTPNPIAEELTKSIIQSVSDEKASKELLDIANNDVSILETFDKIIKAPEKVKDFLANPLPQEEYNKQLQNGSIFDNKGMQAIADIGIGNVFNKNFNPVDFAKEQGSLLRQRIDEAKANEAKLLGDNKAKSNYDIAQFTEANSKSKTNMQNLALLQSPDTKGINDGIKIGLSKHLKELGKTIYSDKFKEDNADQMSVANILYIAGITPDTINKLSETNKNKFIDMVTKSFQEGKSFKIIDAVKDLGQAFGEGDLPVLNNLVSLMGSNQRVRKILNDVNSKEYIRDAAGNSLALTFSEKALAEMQDILAKDLKVITDKKTELDNRYKPISNNLNNIFDIKTYR